MNDTAIHPGIRGTCSFEGCGRPHKARGLCATHYNQTLRGEAPHAFQAREVLPPGTQCSAPECSRPVKSNGLCAAHYQRSLRRGHIKTTTRAFRHRDPDQRCGVAGCMNAVGQRGVWCSGHRRVDWRLQHNYGTSLWAYLEKWQAQDGQCAICRQAFKNDIAHRLVGNAALSAAVDHCHTTGKVRGLLCNNCNSALGAMGDNPARLRCAAAYLEEHGTCAQ